MEIIEQIKIIEECMKTLADLSKYEIYSTLVYNPIVKHSHRAFNNLTKIKSILKLRIKK